MHGDFSRWQAKVPKNQVGILAQEGRILLDADVNAQSLLGMRWQDLAARAAFGAGVAAIPANHLDGWKVISAGVSQGTFTLSVMPGAAWADGLLVELPEANDASGKPVNLIATPLGDLYQDPSTVTGKAGERDAVILEVWRRSLNGYQVPAELIEPALGGPDTAERIETAYALRLYRMADGDTCRNLHLDDNMAQHGRLTVSLAPTTMTAGDCPVVQGGGYTGLEHDLYRVEIADVAQGGPMFKWSQWNGGLVGRGIYTAATQKLALIAGDQAILRSGLTSCYVEVLVEDSPNSSVPKSWRIAYGARATVDMAAGELDLGQTIFGAAPPTSPTDSWFVRVWNDVRPISDFPKGSSNELRDGIRLEFDTTLGNGRYVPGDYWTFMVRAGIDNPFPLPTYAQPVGVHHHRVPLAELTWNGDTATIEDCRVPLHPITATDGCCTHSVGDGITSHGDFTTVQAAVDALPGTGGRVCVLPGTYTENVIIQNRTNVELVGCGPRSRIIAKGPGGENYNPADPAIHVIDTSGIKIEKLYVEGGYQGIAILLEADAAAGQIGIDSGQASTPYLEDMRVADCTVVAGGGSGIEIRGGQRVEIIHNHVSIADVQSDWGLITVATTDARIQRNVVIATLGDAKEYNALGGIWLRGGCVNIAVLDNEITGGAGHGVMLGNAEQSAIIGKSTNYAGKIKVGNFGFVFNGLVDETCIGCGPGPVVFPPPPNNTPTPPWVAGDPLREIRICDNEISRMGISGIGVMGFFPDPSQGVISIDHLEIDRNRIFNNIGRRLAEIDDGAVQLSGYGAISLADVNDLTIRDNEIMGNGRAAAGGVTGVFVLAGSGVEIARNRIYGNGPLRPLRITSATPHGGVWLAYVSAPYENDLDPSPRGRISVAVRNNEIHAPNGPSLYIDGYGYYQVVDNALTSDGTQPTASLATSVQLFNLSGLANFTQPPSFAALKSGALTVAKRAFKVTSGGKAVTADKTKEAELAGAKLTLGPETAIAEAIFLPPPGAIMFANNVVITNTTAAAPYFDVFIIGLIDICVQNNQFIAHAPRAPLTPVATLGFTVRFDNNRCIDGAAVYSAACWGEYVIAAHNITDHCIKVIGTNEYVFQQNLEIDPGACKLLHGLFPILGTEIKA